MENLEDGILLSLGTYSLRCHDELVFRSGGSYAMIVYASQPSAAKIRSLEIDKYL